MLLIVLTFCRVLLSVFTNLNSDKPSTREPGSSAWCFTYCSENTSFKPSCFGRVLQRGGYLSRPLISRGRSLAVGLAEAAMPPRSSFLKFLHESFAGHFKVNFTRSIIVSSRAMFLVVRSSVWSLGYGWKVRRLLAGYGAIGYKLSICFFLSQIALSVFTISKSDKPST